MPKKSPGLKLFTKAWPLRRESKEKQQSDRPLTATLEKPTILDINLIDKLDMSLVRKEFLNIAICRMPLIIKNHKSLMKSAQQSKMKKTKKGNNDNVIIQSVETEEETGRSSEEGLSVRSVKKAKKLTKTEMIHGDANNNKVKKQRKTLTGKIVSASPSNIELPEPCTTCGRPDQPERFHSHPVLPLKNSQTKTEHQQIKIPIKNTVQKPVAMKYKSKKPSAIQKLSIDANSPKDLSSKAQLKSLPSPRVKSAKRTLTCYICGREFGTASLPLHEPKCLERWERENAKLPMTLRRKPPLKPDSSLTKEEFNKKAWEASQATLTPCFNCGRTFYPDRLVVHQRSCKRKTAIPHRIPSTNSNNNSTVSCYVCGRPFTKQSIKLHEEQCIKKWHTENNTLPKDIKSPPPVRRDTENANTKRPLSTPQNRPTLVPCYICGKLFTNHSLLIHELQCMRMWRMENDKLPLEKRRQVPIKPNISFTDDGRIDFVATNEANWQSHLKQLVPCKMCGRTFNPDRVDVHERSCKG